MPDRATLNLPANLHTLEQLIDFFVAQLFTQRRKDVTQLSYTNEAVALLVEDLEPTNELL